MTTAIPPQAITVQAPVVQPKVVKSPTKTVKQPTPKVAPKSPKTPKVTKTVQNKTPKVEKEVKEDKIAKPPKKRKTQSSESETGANEQNMRQAKKQKTMAITKPADHKGLDQRKLYCICKKPYDSKRYINICCYLVLEYNLESLELFRMQQFRILESPK